MDNFHYVLVTIQTNDQFVKDAFFRYYDYIVEGCHLANGVMGVCPRINEKGYITFRLQLDNCIFKQMADKHYLFITGLLREMSAHRHLFTSERVGKI